MNIWSIQTRLKALGFDPGPVDGVLGPKTEAAIIRFKKSVGLRARAFVGPLTKQALEQAQVLPWMSEIGKVMGLHEVRDNGALTKWLRSDGPSVGDPASIAWCGDAVETAVYRALPDEPRFENPYWARNWARFGSACGLVYGAISVFKRGSGGHVAFLVGVSPDGRLLRIRGGNQHNAINDTWIDASRLIDTRWPSSYPLSQQRLAPTLGAKGGIISRNEA